MTYFRHLFPSGVLHYILILYLSISYVRTCVLGTFPEEDSENAVSQYTALCMLCDQKGFVSIPDYSDQHDGLAKNEDNDNSDNSDEDKSNSNGMNDNQNSGSNRMDESSTRIARNSESMVQCVTCHEYVHKHCLPAPTVQVSSMSS